MWIDKEVKKSHLISPWGVGAIVPFPNNESVMICGLNMWQYSDESEFVIEEPRLTERLGVKKLLEPPEYRESRGNKTNIALNIPGIRFPRWHYCPYCGTMEYLSYTDPVHRCIGNVRKNGKPCLGKSILIPERFVVICPEGHIDDFPIAEWIHHGSEHKYDVTTCKIRRSTGGTSTSLSGVYYECTCGAKRSMYGAFNEGALKSIGYECKGIQPWLGIDKKKR